MALRGTYLHQGWPNPVWPIIFRKKERTAALVVSAVLAGFRAVDTGWLRIHCTSRSTKGHMTAGLPA